MADFKNNKDCKPVQFDSIRIRLASPERIREWSTRNNDPDAGVVKKPETINYRTLKPEQEGLFCERIFGPSKDWECHCGKFRKVRYRGVICDKCGVEVTKATVRRERMGRIDLAAPVSHIWYFKGTPTRMGLLLDLTAKQLDKVLYFAAYIVLDPKDTDLEKKAVLSEREYNMALEKYGRGSFRVGMGAEAIEELLKDVDLDSEIAALKGELEVDNGKGQKQDKIQKIVKRLEVFEFFKESGNRPEWMIMNTIPVIPPDLRPMVQLDGGRYATSDLNDLYRRIINRNNRLMKLNELGAPDIIVRNEKRMLQEAVDALIDNGRRGRPVTGPGNRALKSLSDMLKGKGGRFRQNLLGKRVDYSGRSVIVVGPELKIYQCGLPKEMALELFKPFVIRELTKRKICQNVKAAKKDIERQTDQVWDILEDVIQEHPVMLNRAPTLHRLGIQAFEPILVEGRAIKLHPLVCTAFNADFDGDQMAVHLPLTVEAQAECRFLLLSPNNLLKPSDGAPVAVPSQDMVLGIYYLTQERPGSKGEGRYFKDLNEAIMAYETDQIVLHAMIKVRRTVTTPDGRTVTGVVESTLGRFLFNEIIPQDLGMVKRETDEDYLKLEVEGTPVSNKGKKGDASKAKEYTGYSKLKKLLSQHDVQGQSLPEGVRMLPIGKKMLKKILEKVISTHGATRTAEVLDLVKAIGYKYSTRAAMTVSINDMKIPAMKKDILNAAQQDVDYINFAYRRGLSTDEERYNSVIEVWRDTDKPLVNEVMSDMDHFNNIKMMADSGARGSEEQMKQLVGWRGLMAYTSGRTIELPIKSSFREGLDVLEYFMSAHGARKGLSDTALRTADSGYLTRRMVDVSQGVIIRENDCCEGKSEIPYFVVKELRDGDVVEELEKRIKGRYAAEDIKDEDGNIIVEANHMINPKRVEKIMKAGIKEVKIRSILTCKSHVGVCAKCYGANMATGEPVQVGEAVGVIAAQSIGEPGTQLTMRTFHTGGVAGHDITQGLPRVEELFEARPPKGVAIISAIAGKVEINETSSKRQIVIRNEEKDKVYELPYGSRIKVEDGAYVEVGDELTDGSIDPKELLATKDIVALENYIIREVQKVYSAQGADLADKHIEVILRQMLRKQSIVDPGDTEYLPGAKVDRLEIEDRNAILRSEGKREIVANDEIQGITKAAVNTESFLSAASFQETTKVLTEAAIRGKVDPLTGLKENIIIGNLIPAGTGIKRYRDVRFVEEGRPEKVIEDEISFDDEEEEPVKEPVLVASEVGADSGDSEE